MKEIIMNLNSSDNLLYYKNEMKQGENNASQIVVVLNSEWTGYRYLIRFKLNSNEIVVTPELFAIDGLITYNINQVLTNEPGTLKVVFEAFDAEGTVIKSAITNLRIVESLAGGTEIMPEDMVPWYTQAVTQAGIATTKAQEAAASAEAAGTAAAEAVAGIQGQFDAVVANVTIDSEVILARGAEATLPNRLDKFGAQINSLDAEADLRNGAISYGLLTLPTDFPHSLPFNLYRDFDGRIKHDYDMTALFETTADQTLYCDSILGNNTTGDGSESTPYRSLLKCLQIIGASANTTFIIKVKNNVTRDQAHSSSQLTTPLNLQGKKIHIIPNSNTRLFIGNVQTSGSESNEPLVWTADGTAYKITRTNCYNVFDYANKDIYGIPIPLNWVSSASICKTTPNSWYTDEATVWVNTFDGRVPDKDILVGLNLPNVYFDISNGGEIYFRGFDFCSGAPNFDTLSTIEGAVHIAGDLTSVAVFNDCSFVGGYGKKTVFGKTPLTNGLAIRDVGKTYLFNCKGGYTRRDVYNYHYYDLAVTDKRQYLVFEYECMGHRAGRYSNADNSGNNNVSTAHDGICISRVGSYGHNTDGPVCADVGDCYSVLYDCRYRDSDVADVELQYDATSCYQFNNAVTNGLGKVYMENCSGGGRAKWDIYTPSIGNIKIKRFNGRRLSPNVLTSLAIID